jgi:hypothetical protein
MIVREEISDKPIGHRFAEHIFMYSLFPDSLHFRFRESRLHPASAAQSRKRNANRQYFD